jgi:hypothetical protein
MMDYKKRKAHIIKMFIEQMFAKQIILCYNGKNQLLSNYGCGLHIISPHSIVVRFRISVYNRSTVWQNSILR